MCIQHYSIIQSAFTALKTPGFLLLISSSPNPPSRNHWFFYCLHSFAFPHEYPGWNHTVCSLTTKHLRFFHVFLWFESSFIYCWIKFQHKDISQFIYLLTHWRTSWPRVFFFFSLHNCISFAKYQNESATGIQGILMSSQSLKNHCHRPQQKFNWFWRKDKKLGNIYFSHGWVSDYSVYI